ncbi:hypothetical protein D3C85_939590 [compost metagenome]
MLGGKLTGHLDYAIKGLRLVVGQVSHDRRQRATGVQVLGVPGHRIANLRIDDALVIADGGPFGVALEHAGGITAHCVRQRGGALHAGDLRQLPTQAIDLGQGLVGATAIVAGFHHDGEHVAGNAVVRSDERIVEVIA